MNRFFAFLLALCLMMGSVALAEGKLKVTDKTLIVYDGDDSGYFFARIENTGDAPIAVGYGNLVTFDDEDEIIFSDGLVSVSPSYVMLDPGEFVFACEFLWETVLKEKTVADFKFSAEKRTSGDQVTILPASIEYDLKGAGTYENYIYVTIANDSDEMLEAPYMVAVLYDEEGNIAYVGAESLSALQIHPHSKVTVKLSVSNDMLVYYNKHGVKIAEAAAHVYIEK